MVVAELAAHAITHGRVPGQDAELRLTAEPCGRHVRIEVSDARGERRPVMPQSERPDMDGGRGLALVEPLAGERSATERSGGPGKTVWAVVPCTAPHLFGPRADVPFGSHGLHVPGGIPPGQPRNRN
ncbi:ATP-binding protein [Streptomyces pratens]|uniref:ATP-binding protein n=1 Tax=Streptomyces pratens TaxID=887456 RepID=A0ABW1LVZ6_9ACTN